MDQTEGEKALRAGRLLVSLCESIPEPEVGYRIQGIAAQILLRLGARILEIKSQGHPDIVARDAEGIIRVEVETDLGSGRTRLPTPEDIQSVRPKEQGDRGYFALAECRAFPRWLVVPVERLTLRHVEMGPTVLAALSEEGTSRSWTREFLAFLIRNESRLPGLTYDRLRTLALESRSI